MRDRVAPRDHPMEFDRFELGQEASRRNSKSTILTKCHIKEDIMKNLKNKFLSFAEYRAGMKSVHLYFS